MAQDVLRNGNNLGDAAKGNDVTSQEEREPARVESLGVTRMIDIPDDCLVPILKCLVSNIDKGNCRLVCRRWLYLQCQAIQSLHLKAGAHARLHDFKRLLSTLRSLTSVSLPIGSLDLEDWADPESMTVPWHSRTKTNVAIHLVSMYCPLLTSLHIDFHQRPDFTPEYLDRLSASCPALTDLTLGNGTMGHLPTSLTILPCLKRLTLKMPFLRRLPREICQMATLEWLSIQECSALGPLVPVLQALTSIETLELRKVCVSSGALLTLPHLSALVLDSVICENNASPMSSFSDLLKLTSLDLQGLEFPFNFGFHYLPSLRRLRIANCSFRQGNLNIASCLSGMPVLESLTVQDVLSLTTLSCQHEALSTLHISFPFRSRHCLKVLPDFQLHALRSFSLENCQLTNLSPRLMSPSLCTLSLVNAFGNFIVLPQTFGSLTALQTCHLSSQFSIDMAQSLQCLVALRHLTLKSKDAIIWPESPSLLPQSLISLHITCPNASGMPLHPGQLWALEYLSLNITNMVHLPETIAHFRSLRSFCLVGCHKLSKLPESLGQLASLHQLELEDCTSLLEIPATVCDLSALHHISIVGADRLKSLPDKLEEMQSLRHFELRNCPQLELAPARLSAFESSREVLYDNCGIYSGAMDGPEQREGSVRRLLSKLKLRRSKISSSLISGM